MTTSAYDFETLEGGDASEEDYYTACQQAINGGVAWQFQGSVGRTLIEAIEAGKCCLGRVGCRDYYNNYIPSRDEVQEGTKGSVSYVVEHSGQEWADHIAAI